MAHVIIIELIYVCPGRYHIIHSLVSGEQIMQITTVLSNGQSVRIHADKVEAEMRRYIRESNMQPRQTTRVVRLDGSRTKYVTDIK